MGVLGVSGGLHARGGLKMYSPAPKIHGHATGSLEACPLSGVKMPERPPLLIGLVLHHPKCPMTTFLFLPIGENGKHGGGSRLAVKIIGD